MQNYPHIEIIIVDGYSDDDTINIAKNLLITLFFDNGTYGSACQLVLR
jgi:glycosyltransferase involved in cell wall biosynthesis